MAAFTAKYPRMSKALGWTWKIGWAGLDAYFIYELFFGEDDVTDEVFDEATEFAVDELMGTPLTQEALSIIYSPGRMSDAQLAVANYVNKTQVEDLDDEGLGIIACALDYKSKAFDNYVYSSTQTAAILTFISLLPTGTIPSEDEISDVMNLVLESVNESRFNETFSSIESDYIAHYYVALFTNNNSYDSVLSELSDVASASAAISAYFAQDTAMVKSNISKATGVLPTDISPAVMSADDGSFTGLKFD